MVRALFALAALVGAMLPAPALAQSDDDELRVESPYFEIFGDPKVDRLPLKSTVVSADVLGVVADVHVTQVYKNEGEGPIEAVYVFPMSTRAAITGLQMRIGDRFITATIKENQQAKAEYEAAKAQGKTASLLEQQRPNVFRMNVANVLPGETIEVTLRYSELMVPEEGVYEFVYPTAIGPHYVSPGESYASASQAQGPSGSADPSVAGTFDLAVHLTAGLPIQSIDSPSHVITTTMFGRNEADVQIAQRTGPRQDRDFQLRYTLRGGAIETGLLLGDSGGERFFMLMMQPPKSFEPAMLPPREYIFIVDVSGSMNGFPHDTAKYLMRELLGDLGEDDRFNLLLFASGYAKLAERSLPVTRQSIADAMTKLEEVPGGGGTEILPAMQTALALPREDGMARTVVLITDGLVTASAELFDTVRANLGDANLFVFGPGGSVNRGLLEATARIGYGEPIVVTDATEAPAAADRFHRYIAAPLLTKVRVKYVGFDAYEVEPQPVPDLFAQRPLVIIGKYRGAPQGKIQISGMAGRKPYAAEIDVGAMKPSQRTSGIAALWARRRIQTLGDYEGVNVSRKDEITALGLKYGLATKYTSFLAVDEIVRTIPGTTETVRQPTPKPRDYGSGPSSSRRASGLAVAPQEISLEVAGAVASATAARSCPSRDATTERELQRGELIEIRITRDSDLYELLLAHDPDFALCAETQARAELRVGRFLIVVDEGVAPVAEPALLRELRALLLGQGD